MAKNTKDFWPLQEHRRKQGRILSYSLQRECCPLTHRFQNSGRQNCEGTNFFCSCQVRSTLLVQPWESNTLAVFNISNPKVPALWSLHAQKTASSSALQKKVTFWDRNPGPSLCAALLCLFSHMGHGFPPSCPEEVYHVTIFSFP